MTNTSVDRETLRELQRISDAGYDEAGDELNRLLKAPADGHWD
ncbi:MULTISPECIES: hypothetical protein [unclassified Streptomyces]|nr:MULTISPECIES: hypothetical protein [unclassified Streptomyces]MCX4399570.1 hypothetical protein [Streptomyces sp. NBC_01767]WSC33632.1 hypothetical protein OG902_44435 [Streptomyces sp. NBC_01768]